MPSTPDAELAVRVSGAEKNGISAVEIREALLLVAIYVGMAAELEGSRIGEDASRDQGGKSASFQMIVCLPRTPMAGMRFTQHTGLYL